MKHDKRAVLIAPSPYIIEEDPGLTQPVSLPSMPLGILALGSFLQQNDVPVELVDVPMDYGIGLTDSAVCGIDAAITDYLVQECEDIGWIGISCLAKPHATNGLRLGQMIKTALPDVPLIFGGYFSSAYHGFLMDSNAYLDGIVYGDGELPALEISRQLARGYSLSGSDLPGWICRDAEGRLIKSERAQPPAPDELPILDFTLLKHHDQYPIACMRTSTGCPYQCSYCIERAMRPYCAISLAKVAQELSLADETLPCEYMFVVDPTFGLGQQRLRDLIRIFRQTKFNFILESRADALDPSQIADLGKARVECLSLGIESASPSTLLRMGKIGNRSQYAAYIEGARRIAAECFQHNITLGVGMMVGYPGDTLQDFRASFDFVMELAGLHEQVRRETGCAPGFIVFPNYTRVYPGSVLAGSMQDFPNTEYRAEAYDGEFSVIAPSPGYTFEMLDEHVKALEKASVLTPLAEQRVIRYIGFSLDAFVADHPQFVQDGTLRWRGPFERLTKGDGSLRYSPFGDDNRHNGTAVRLAGDHNGGM